MGMLFVYPRFIVPVTYLRKEVWLKGYVFWKSGAGRVRNQSGDPASVG